MAPLQDAYSEALPTQAKRKEQSWEGGGFENRLFWKCLRSIGVHSRLLDQPHKRTGLHYRRAGEWDYQITLDRGPQCTTACTRRQRAAELAQIEGRPARQARPHQGRDPVRCAVGMEASTIRPAYIEIAMSSNLLYPPISRAAARWTRLSFSIRTPGRPAIFV